MKLLKNTAFVGVLALVAIGFVTKNIILPLFKSSRPPSRVVYKEEITQKKGIDIQQIESIVGGTLPVADFEQLGWVLDYARDPFKIKTLLLEAEQGPEPVVEEEKPVIVDIEDKTRNYALIAVVGEPGKRLAVINDAIVSEGDYYQDYEVIKINSDSVVLKGPGGQKKLEF